ncbi:MAG: NADP-dependent oxidoreductase [Acidobacteria bacterium]|nr:NADP-dependent oxidoreductase [Acidobacteriota bacterium]
MKAVVLHEYGGPSKLKVEEMPDPKPGEGEVLVRVEAVSLNPVDWKMRSGAAKDHFPVQFPGILGRDFAGVIRELGPGVDSKKTGFSVGDLVFGLGNATYAELCVVKVSELAHIPAEMEIADAATVPLVALTGDQLIRRATKVQAGQTIVITGALGSVGRCAMFAALEMGAKVIAGVRKKQMHEAVALGATAAVDVEDDASIAALGTVDGVADTLNHEIATKLIAKVKPGGTFGSVLGPPSNASLHPTVTVNAMMAVPDPQTVVHYAKAIHEGKLKLPLDRVMPMADVAEAHALAEKGAKGKIVITM